MKKKTIESLTRHESEEVRLMNDDHDQISQKRWSNLVHKIGLHAENVVDLVRDRFRQRIIGEKPMKIIAFKGMGNETTCRLRGRVLEYKEHPRDDADSIWANLHNSYRRFETDEVPGITVRAISGEHQYEAITDEEGYFTLEFAPPRSWDSHRLTVMLSLPEHSGNHQQTPATLFFTSPQAAFGVISDIDDTVLVTEATSIIKMMRLTLLQSSRSRVAFHGVASFYDALHAEKNPFFYVSSSPWNLFEFLDDFLQLNRIADGPILLRDFGIDSTKLVAGPHKVHKLTQIRSILDFYSNLCFILIGDSGQKDPEIYAQIVDEYPGRILSIYIRDAGHAARDRQVQAIARRLQAQSVDMLLVPDTLAAANHAAGKGYIAAERTTLVTEAVHSRDTVV